MRTWLYRIATNRCLNALRDRGRRLPRCPARGAAGAARADAAARADLARAVPTRSTPLEPEARYEAREAIGLAFIAALQRLPPRQRAVLVLRDVLGFRAAEAAEMLGVTEAP